MSISGDVSDENALNILITERFDVSQMESFRDVLHNQYISYDHFVVDLQQLEYIDSFGLSLIMTLLASVNYDENKLCIVIKENHAIRRIFEMARLHEILNII